MIHSAALAFTGLSFGSGLNFIGSKADLFLGLILKNPFATSLIVPSPPIAAILLYPFFNNLRVRLVPSLAFFVNTIRWGVGRNFFIFSYVKFQFFLVVFLLEFV